MRRTKNCKNMSREELLIALLKSDQSHAGLRRIKNNNELINRSSKEKIKKTKSITKYLKELERQIV